MPTPAGHAERGVGNGEAGAFLFLSTPSQHLCDYDIYHSEAEPIFGPFHQRFAYLGTIGKVYPQLLDVAAVNHQAGERVPTRHRPSLFC